MRDKIIKLAPVLFGLFLTISFFGRSLVQDKLFVSDDYQHHAARTANYYLAIKQGQFPVRWAPNLNDGYGYPVFNYIYPLPYIAATLLFVLGASIQLSVNLAMLGAMLLAGFSSFVLLSLITRNRAASFIGSLVYVLSPYPLLNVFWRGALGEVFFIGFAPLLFTGFYLALRNKQAAKNRFFTWILICLSTAALILSHAPSLLVLAVLLLSYLFLKWWQRDFNKFKNNLILIGSAVGGGLMLTAWYWAPAMLERNYIKYNQGSSLAQHTDQFIDFGNLVLLNTGIHSNPFFMNVVQLGIVPVLILLTSLTLIVFKPLSKAYKKSLVWGILIFAASFIFTTRLSAIFWDNFKPLQMLQYPWRILWVVLLVSIYLMAVNHKLLSNKFRKVLYIIFSVLILHSAFSYAAIKGTQHRSDYEWFETVATGSSFDEHQPKWSHKPYYFANQEIVYLQTADLKLASQAETPEELDNLVKTLNTLDSQIIQKNGTTIEYQLTTEQPLIVLHKRLYFPGWQLEINGQKSDLQTQVPQYEGVMGASLPAGVSHVKLSFTSRTKIRLAAELVSLTTLILLGSAIFLKVQPWFLPGDK